MMMIGKAIAALRSTDPRKRRQTELSFKNDRLIIPVPINDVLPLKAARRDAITKLKS